MTNNLYNIDFKGKRRTAAIIDLNAIKQNIIKIRNKVGNRVKICPAVKADAYGHGAVEVSKMLENEKLVDYFGVATVDEGIELRENGIKLPIMLFSLIMEDEATKAIKNNLTLTVANKELVNAIGKEAEKLQIKTKIHIKIDTGMGRIGCKPEETIDIARHILKYKYLELEGLLSHFPISDEKDKTFTYKQIDIFKNVIKELEENNIFIKIKHVANSGAILDIPESYFDMVRPGIMIYGHYPSKETSESIKLKPAMALRSEIYFIKRVKKGTSISYGRTYFTEKDTYIATIPAGYADGINRLLSNNHNVIINGKFYPIAGRVCMDQFLIDLGDDFYPIGTEVFIFDQNNYTASDLAWKINTIPYEVTCWVSKRVKRYYIK